MPTLRELIDKHGMGQGQRYKTDDQHLLPLKKGNWFEPKLISPNGDWIVGFERTGRPQHVNLAVNSQDWSLYEEPKKKVTRWLWAITKEGVIGTDITGALFTEEEAKEVWGNHEIQKLEWSRTEFEE